MSPPEFRILLKRSEPTLPLPARELVYEHSRKAKCYCFGLIPTSNGYLAKVQSLVDIDLMLTPEATRSLSKINLTPIAPPDLLARKTVFVRQVEPFVGERSESELKAEIQKLNPSVRIDKVVKIPNRTRMFKILLLDAHSVELILHEGFKAFNCRISPSQISAESRTRLVNCYKCYAIEKHDTRHCPYPTVTRCSNCAASDHIHINCPTPSSQKCFNCKFAGKPFEDHHTLQSRCPIRKAELKLKRDACDSANKQTYAGAAAPTPHLPPRHSLLPLPGSTIPPLLSLPGLTAPPPLPQPTRPKPQLPNRPRNNPTPTPAKPPTPTQPRAANPTRPKSPIQMAFTPADPKTILRMTAILIDAHLVSANMNTSYRARAEAAILKNFGIVVALPESSAHTAAAMISSSETLVEEIQSPLPTYSPVQKSPSPPKIPTPRVFPPPFLITEPIPEPSLAAPTYSPIRKSPSVSPSKSHSDSPSRSPSVSPSKSAPISPSKSPSASPTRDVLSSEVSTSPSPSHSSSATVSDYEDGCDSPPKPNPFTPVKRKNTSPHQGTPSKASRKLPIFFANATKK